jgi:hypothetical protein
MKQKIRMRFFQHKTTLKPLPEAYEFKPGTGWRRIVQRFCWDFLKRTEALVSASYEVTVPHKDIVIDTGHLADKVVAAIRELELYYNEVEVVYVGLQDYMEFKRLLFSSSTFTVTSFPEDKLFGIPVVMVPWMEGVLVVPKRSKKI